jgi:DNA end-binding protein Ku
MAEDFNPDRYHDTYQEQLQELIEAKLEGGEAFTAEERPKDLDETEDVSDLLAKLEASVRARSRDGDGQAPAKKAAAKKTPAANKTPAKKTAAKKAGASSGAKKARSTASSKS